MAHEAGRFRLSASAVPRRPGISPSAWDGQRDRTPPPRSAQGARRPTRCRTSSTYEFWMGGRWGCFLHHGGGANSTTERFSYRDERRTP